MQEQKIQSNNQHLFLSYSKIMLQEEGQFNQNTANSISSPTGSSSSKNSQSNEYNKIIQNQVTSIIVEQSQQALFHWKKGDFYLKQNRIEQAIQQYKKCVQLNYQIPDQFIGLGCMQDRIGYHYDTLISWYDKMKNETNKKSSPYDALSLCLEKTNQYQSIKQWYEIQIEKHPQEYRLYFGLANLQYNNKKFAQALKLYEKVIDLSSQFDQSYQKIGNIYCLKWNKDEQANKWIELALNRNKNSVFTQILQAFCMPVISQRVKLLYDIAVNHPDYARIYNGLGNAYFNLKDYQKAIENYKKSIQVCSRYDHPFYGLGSIYNHLDKYDDSIQWYKKCIEVNPMYDFPHYGLGIAYNNKNDIKNAVVWLKKCIQINPLYDCSYYALGNIARYQKKFRQAIQYYKTSLKYKPIDALCYVNLALSFIEIKQYIQANEFLEKARQTLFTNDSSLSLGNIEYIKQQTKIFLDQQEQEQGKQQGFLTFNQRIKLSKLEKKYQKQMVTHFYINQDKQ